MLAPYDLRNRYLSSLEAQPPAFFQEHPTGDLMARATNDLQAVRMLCGPAIMYACNTFFTAMGTPKPNSQIRQSNTYGVLKLTLRPTSYDWQFVPVAGQTFTDSGSTACH